MDIEHSHLSKLFTSIIVVTKKSDISHTDKVLKEYFSDNTQTIRLTEGANERIQSFLFGLEDLTKAGLVDEESIVALFDANRPFTSMGQIHDLHEAALTFGCSCPARPLVNGVARMELNQILEVPDKSNYFEFVTPEFMQFNKLNVTLKKNMEVFSSLVEYSLNLGLKPMTLEASSLNTKLTYPEDKTFLEGLALDNQLLKPTKVGH